MRGMVVGLVLLVMAGLVWATNPGGGPPPGSTDHLRAEASSYATQMMAVLSLVDQRYVRPIPRAALAEAALTGLFETAREPMPAGLKADLGQAKNPQEISHLLAATRERLGDLEALRGNRALYASLRTLPRALDPYSGLTNPNDRRGAYGEQTHGVGLEFESLPPGLAHSTESDPLARPRGTAAGDGTPRGPARVAQVFPGSPAQRAGVRAGDVLVLINDHPLESAEGARLFPQLVNEPDHGEDPLKLSFQRPGQTGLAHYRLRPESFTPESVFGVRRRLDHSWDYLLDRTHKIAYLRLGFIDQGSVGEMVNAINGLRSAGMRALIFDLRGNPGGFVNPAQSISGMFVKSGLVATVRDRQGKEDRFTINEDSTILDDIPAVALIDSETRGGGEMIAAVLQDHKVAMLAGQRTFGKGSVQTTFGGDGVQGAEVFDKVGGQFKLTTGLFTRPSGKNLHRFPDSKLSDDWGVRPDKGLEYPVSPELARRIKEWMHEQVMRPGDSRAPLPLDDPDNDPLREFARQLLLKKIKS